MQHARGLRVVQANPSDPTTAIETAWEVGSDTIAWDLRFDCTEALRMAKAARIRSEGWYSVARDLKASLEHPEWMHAPSRTDWAGGGRGMAVVAPYISLNNRKAFAHAQRELLATVHRNPWCGKLWLGDIQGAPMGCGSGDLCCRSWDNSPGQKMVEPSRSDSSDRFFSEMFFETFVRKVWSMERPIQVVPVLAPGCGEGCGDHDWHAMLEKFRTWRGSLFVPQIALLLMSEALGKSPGSWPRTAHEHCGLDLFPCVEREDARAFRNCMVMLDAPQNVWPVAAPANYEAPPMTVTA